MKKIYEKPELIEYTSLQNATAGIFTTTNEAT